jgi:hypothetical protein
MKYTIAVVLFFSCAITLALGVRAQDAAPKTHSMTGCLAKGDAPDTYKLTNVEGGKVDSVGIVSSDVKLAAHVGHKVELTGTAVPKKDAEMDANVPKAPHYMKITAMKHISPTCP